MIASTRIYYPNNAVALLLMTIAASCAWATDLARAQGKTPGLCFLAALIFTGSFTPLEMLRAAEPQQVSFPSGKLKLEGFIYKPEGKGPFPAVLYNHGSERKPGWQPDLGDLFSKKGYVFFLPHRRGHGRSPNDAQVDSLYQEGVRSVVALQDIHLEDQLAALAFLKQLSYVDRNRIAVAGCSSGGIQTVLAAETNAEQKLGLRSTLNFAGAAITWRLSSGLRDRMIQAVRKSTIPMLFAQAENDYDLTPSRTLAGELEKLGKPHKLAIFPPFGEAPDKGGHAGFCYRAGAVWGAEVFTFLDSTVEK